jgi:hypothetical protein
MSQVSIQISNIESNYSSTAILMNDFINSMVEYLLSAVYGIVDGREYLSLSEDGQTARTELDPDFKVSIDFIKENGADLSIRSIFSNDLIVKYDIVEKNDLLDEIKSFSPELAEDVKYVIENNGKEVANLYDKGWNAQPVSVEAISESYKDVTISNTKDYLFNTILHKITRSGHATVADILTLCDGVNIELKSVSFITNF